MFAATSRENVASSLRALLGTRAETAYEKYTLLEQRDKILRKARQRVSDVQRAAAFVGVCPDMCPEKERYEREVQKRLSSFEMTGTHDYTVDHGRAVKDYGRSAADQEDPLPYELRPAPVLEMTMNYLLNEIAYNEPSEESQLPSWYDFLWKRTRAIRKDMTQQMLEGDVALSLFEKCTRFHIFCAHRLCELEIGEFDQRMNTENLTKCLQSLKHMYEDMRKKNLPCPNEAEFRAYDVLLSLNDTDVLRQILMYDPAVRQSTHVRFALRLFSAMQNNNYVAFFRLVRRQGTYLQACLVHRYFNVVRAKAFNTMVKSYGPNSLYPAADLTRMLGFENMEEATQFALVYGLIAHPKGEGLLTLNRWQLSSEELQQPSLKRSYVLVECKRQGSLGEILNGAPLLPVMLPSPAISFDENHYFRGDKVFNDILQNAIAGETTMTTTKSVPMATLMPVDEPRRLLRTAQNSATVVIESVIKDALGQLVTTEMRMSKLVYRLFSDVVSASVRSVVEDALQRERKSANEMQQRKALREAGLAFKEKAVNDLIAFCVVDNVRRLIQEVTKELRQSKAKQELRAVSSAIFSKLFDESLAQNVAQYCSRIFQEEVEFPLIALNRIRMNLSNILIRRYILKWRSIAYTKSYRRRLMNEFPCCPFPSLYTGQSPPEKRQHVDGTSRTHWTEVLTIRDFALRSIMIVLDAAVHSTVLSVVTDELRQQKVTKPVHFPLVPQPIFNYAGHVTATSKLLADFPCHPSTSEQASTVGRSGRKRCRNDDESVYSWMDNIRPVGPLTDHHPCSGGTLPALSRPVHYDDTMETEEPIEDDGRRKNLFKDIPLTPSKALKLETMAAMKRLRSAVQAERHETQFALEKWSSMSDKEG